ncbi:MAG: sugar phosphate isomerase/epimerase family protein [Fervidicoccaceae archaeon]
MRFAFTIWPKSKITEKDVHYASSIGFESVEISLEYPWPYWEFQWFEDLMKLIKEQGLKLGAHLPWRDLAIASPYPEIRKGSIDYLTKLSELMKKWEFQYAVSHFSTREKVKFTNREYLNEIFMDVKRLVSSYKDAGIIFALENSPYGPLAFKDNLMLLANEVDSQVCLDYGHITAKLLQEEKLSFLEDMLLDWTNSFHNVVSVVHIHGASKINGQVVEHMKIEGYETSFAKVLKVLENAGKNPFVTLEVFFKDEQFRDADIETLANQLELLKQAKMPLF